MEGVGRRLRRRSACPCDRNPRNLPIGVGEDDDGDDEAKKRTCERERAKWECYLLFPLRPLKKNLYIYIVLQ